MPRKQHEGDAAYDLYVPEDIEIHYGRQVIDMKFAIEDELDTSVDLLTTEGVKPRFYELIKDDRILLYGA